MKANISASSPPRNSLPGHLQRRTVEQYQTPFFYTQSRIWQRIKVHKHAKRVLADIRLRIDMHRRFCYRYTCRTFASMSLRSVSGVTSSSLSFDLIVIPTPQEENRKEGRVRYRQRAPINSRSTASSTVHEWASRPKREWARF